MNGTTFRMPARRLTTVALATALAAGPAALAGAGPAAATGDHGSASAFVLRTGLDVSLVNKTLNVPLAVSLNAVQAPRSAQETALSAQLDGVAGGHPFDVVRAEAADAKATVSSNGAEASTSLAHARVHLPGLPMLSLIEVEGVTSKAVCAPGKRPVATANLLGAVTILGRKVTATAGGPTDVKVPGVGEVRAEVSPTRVSSRTAAASALVLTVSVNPLNLNVAEVKGTVTLASASCGAPAGSGTPGPGTAATEPDVKPQGAPAKAAGAPAKAADAPAKSHDLAETGGSSATPYIVAGAIALLAVGGGAIGVARRRRG
ncbi:SCO1860 family LAETG-anchored protein [Streptomyces sp. NPDC047022]|uniref:SCO1860 family LAETG-anchored protein n=1 Tax=Streptomyces sp. NPDC047022 TaxID=3155737 RepID=UPI0033F76E8A